MSDFFEIDFLDVESSKSGDAITVRYQINNISYIHVVDGGFQATGEKVVEHINKYYGNPTFIDRVIVTHPDGDHAGGLRAVLEHFTVGELWMLRPWIYADEIIDRFTSVENLKTRLKQIYPNLAALEEIAKEKDILIYEPFQGATIGEFKVSAPSRQRYLDLIVDSEKTPESVEETEKSAIDAFTSIIEEAAKKFITLIKTVWGDEVFSPNETSAENEMSVVQYANIEGRKILLTGDVGRTGLNEAADFSPNVGLNLPGIDRFQVPHHGSRRNVSTEMLDRWLGDVMNAPAEPMTLIPTRANTNQTTNITVDSLGFKYSDEHPWLYRNLTFNIQAGHCVVVMGPSGCGKSTLAKLLLGFYQPQEGNIKINGQDIRYLAANELRNHFGVVPQETVIFSGTIYDNLILTNPHASFEQIIQACQLAEIHNTIEQLPQGYQTTVGEHGTGLSGGQKQRIAIARALLKQPKVLIFDEAVSNLDQQTAEHFAQTVNKLKGKVTILFITHQLPKGLNVDEAVVLGKTEANQARNQNLTEEVGND